MIRAISQKQLPLSEFKTPFEATMDENNRWVKLAQVIPWDQMAEPYMACFHIHARATSKRCTTSHRGSHYQT